MTEADRDPQRPRAAGPAGGSRAAGGWGRRGVLSLAAGLPLGLLARPGSGRAQDGGRPVDVELVLAADGSGSIDDDELATQRRGYADALTHPRVLQAIQGGYHGRIALTFIEWGGGRSQHTIVDWREIAGAGDAQAFGDALMAAPRAARGWNSISGAIAYGHQKIDENGFAGHRKVIDISGDGPQRGGPPLGLTRQQAVDAGITINALVVRRPGGGYPGPGGMPLADHYERDVIGGRGAFVMTADAEIGFTDAILNKLIQEIADVRPTGAARG
ncbi:hypothetical protein CKO28_06560 [Rhodovibrio sodomensis]|uniref:VWFA domain-containing protein n=1 Tax=Rhodovibrio sodomensis TaxID=1088 RepID=A0ABS1DBE4_9PROT|nr:DUF1194 domain-containing protein [Rhodovibrio sodomensis]MBK1667695.1 hypothetical protein [Rhodovibrio sodomensis]